jgi:hypothetical protein
VMLTMMILMVLVVLMMMVEMMIARWCDDDHDDHDADGDDRNVLDLSRHKVCYDAWRCYVGFALRLKVWRLFRNRCEMIGSTPAFNSMIPCFRDGLASTVFSVLTLRVGNVSETYETNEIDPRL